MRRVMAKSNKVEGAVLAKIRTRGQRSGLAENVISISITITVLQLHTYYILDCAYICPLRFDPDHPSTSGF